MARPKARPGPKWRGLGPALSMPGATTAGQLSCVPPSLVQFSSANHKDIVCDLHQLDALPVWTADTVTVFYVNTKLADILQNVVSFRASLTQFFTAQERTVPAISLNMFCSQQVSNHVSLFITAKYQRICSCKQMCQFYRDKLYRSCICTLSTNKIVIIIDFSCICRPI